MPRYVVTEFVEQHRFVEGRERLIRIGPSITRVILTERLNRMKEEIRQHDAIPPGLMTHPDLDGSYVLEREGMRVRYYVTPSARPGRLRRWLGRLSGSADVQPVRIRLLAIDWPVVEHWSGS